MLLTWEYLTVLPTEARIAHALPKLRVTGAAAIGRIAVHLSAEVWQAVNTYTMNASIISAKQAIETDGGS